MKGRGRAIAATLAAAWLVSATIVVAACIPDLPGDQPPPPPGCGDGFIDLDAGEQCDPGLPVGTGGCSSTCKMQCNGLVWPENDHCYELAPQTTSVLSGAISECSDLANAHVVTFASEEEFLTVASYFHAIDPGPFWVGIDNGLTVAQPGPEPGWTPSCPGCYVHSHDSTAALPRFDASLPDGAPLREACVTAFSDTRVDTWEQYPCSGATKLHLICEREPTGRQSQPCEAGICLDLVLTHAVKRYVYVPTPVAADAAEGACRTLGGSLVVLRSRDEREQLWLQLSRLDAVPASIWIGLSETSDAGASADGGAQAWVWDDGTPAAAYPPVWSTTVQAAVPPGQSRAYLWKRGATFADDTLAHNESQPSTMPFVCELPVADAGP